VGAEPVKTPEELERVEEARRIQDLVVRQLLPGWHAILCLYSPHPDGKHQGVHVTGTVAIENLEPALEQLVRHALAAKKTGTIPVPAPDPERKPET